MLFRCNGRKSEGRKKRSLIQAFGADISDLESMFGKSQQKGSGSLNEESKKAVPTKKFKTNDGSSANDFYRKDDHKPFNI
jgi:hypothetical protein